MRRLLARVPLHEARVPRHTSKIYMHAGGRDPVCERFGVCVRVIRHIAQKVRYLSKDQRTYKKKKDQAADMLSMPGKNFSGSKENLHSAREVLRELYSVY